MELLRFHFGFALLLDGTIAGFRVQDHLRRMGLARRAMSLLVPQRPGLALLSEVPGVLRMAGKTASRVTAATHQEVLRHLFESVGEIQQADQRVAGMEQESRQPNEERWQDE